MDYVELAFTVPAEAAETCAAVLIDAGAAGVEERDASTLASPGEGRATVIAWVPPAEVDDFLSLAQAAWSPLSEAHLARRDRSEEEWRDVWKRHFRPRRIGRFVIVPSWDRYQPSGDQVVLDLDPGRAFGTGGHASTRLCLEALGALPPRSRFLDLGCGSGVLAIACARAWPEAHGIGLDLDPDAVEVSRENAARNGVADRISFATTGLEAIADRFDVVVANIQPEVLIPVAATLAARVAPAGRLILAGILVEAAPAVEAAYAPTGLTLLARHDEEGWRALEYAAPGQSAA